MAPSAALRYRKEVSSRKIIYIKDLLGSLFVIVIARRTSSLPVYQKASAVSLQNISMTWGSTSNATEFIPNSWDNFDFALWDRSIAVNLTAPFYLVQNLRNNLKEGASVVNIASADAYAENANVNKFAHYQTPLGRNATTQEIAQVAEFLISEKASFVNAAVVAADGGYSSVDYIVKKEGEG